MCLVLTQTFFNCNLSCSIDKVMAKVQTDISLNHKVTLQKEQPAEKHMQKENCDLLNCTYEQLNGENCKTVKVNGETDSKVNSETNGKTNGLPHFAEFIYLSDESDENSDNGYDESSSSNSFIMNCEISEIEKTIDNDSDLVQRIPDHKSFDENVLPVLVGTLETIDEEGSEFCYNFSQTLTLSDGK